MIYASVIGSALVQIMACRLYSTKPLPEPILVYCQLDSREHISVKWELKFDHFHSRKCIRNCRLPRCRPFCLEGDELIASTPSHDTLVSSIMYKSQKSWNSANWMGNMLDTLRPAQNGCQAADDIFKGISLTHWPLGDLNEVLRR